MVRWLALGMTGCGEDDSPAAATRLPMTDQVIRVSMAVRGVRPTVDELAVAVDDANGLSTLLDGWMASPEFEATIRDLHNEIFTLRVDTAPVLPTEGPAEPFTVDQLYEGTTEAALRLASDIVVQGRPYSEIVTADSFRGDAALAAVYGLAFDPEGPELQEMWWTDGRPGAGVLADSEMWRRHVSNGSNFNRGRAAAVASAFLCDELADRDVVVEGGIDLTDEAVVANAVLTQPSCVGCHQTLDPLAAYFWGFKVQLMGVAVASAYRSDCAWPYASDADPPSGGLPSDFCYPLKMYTPANENDWALWGLRAPGYYGQPGAGLDDLGQKIADDPRFWDCTTRRFAGFLRQETLTELDPDAVARWRQIFVDSGLDARALVRAIVLDDSFLDAEAAGGVGLMVARPEAMGRAVERLTGFEWRVEPLERGCSDDCWADVNLLESDVFGFRAMAGGIDGSLVLTPTHTATPTRQLVWMRHATEAAAAVVDADLLLPAGQRRLLTHFEAGADEPALRQVLVDLYWTLLLEIHSPDDEEIDLAFAFLQGAMLAEGERNGLVLFLSTLLRDPAMVTY